MNYPIKIGHLISLCLLIWFGWSCKTDPIIPPGGVPLDPPIQDPGFAKPCSDDIISFHHEVLPIMVSSCAYSGCHDVISAEEGVILDSYDHIIRSVVPGKPEESELYEYLVTSDGDDIMPPPPAHPLNRRQISIIRDWILQGAENTVCGTLCDSTQTSFSTDVYPLLQDYCIGCHRADRADGNVRLDDYQQVLPYIENNALMGTIRHDQFFPIMPPTGSKISNCRINQVRQWIEEGALNN